MPSLTGRLLNPEKRIWLYYFH